MQQQTLNKTFPVKYSAREKEVFEVINEASPNSISTKEIGEKIFSGKVFHVKESVISALNSLRKKVEHNNEPFTIEVTGHSGPSPMHVRIIPRNKK